MSIDIFNINIEDYFDNDTIESAKESTDNQICNNCGGYELIDDNTSGYIVCHSCGQVQGSIIDNNPEWKTYDDNNTNKEIGRCGKSINQLLPKSSLGTNVNAYGRIKILHGWNSMPYKERSLNYVFKKIKTKCQENNIPKKIEDDALIMYKIISECKHDKGKNKGKYIITRGVNREGIIAASIFYACRRNFIARSPKEIAKMFGLEEIDINRGAKNFLKLRKINMSDGNMGTSKPIDFIQRKCDELCIGYKHTQDALKIAKNIDKLNIASKHTSYSLAAACILLMAHINKLDRITKKKIAEIFEVSDVTISKTFKQLIVYKDILLNDKKVGTIVEDMNNAEDVEIIDREIYDRMIKFGVDVTGYIIKEEGENKVEKKNEQLKLRPKIPVYLEKESESVEFDAIYDY